MHRLSTPVMTLSAIVIAALLSACGGGDRQDGSARQATTDKTPPVALLVDDEGQAMPSQAGAVPADAAARTRAGRYATAAQARDYEAALGEGVLHVTLAGHDAGELELALQLLVAEQVAKDLPDSAPVLVRGNDLRLAALAVDRLAVAGRSHVWLVTP